MSDADFADVEAVVRTIAETAVANEKYFGDLDAVVGDGDFGYSMARGFELVLEGWDGLRPDRHRHLPQEGRDRDHQPHRRHLGPDLGHRVPARGHHRRRGDDARRRPDRRDAAGVDRRDQGARQVRPRRQDPARRARAGRGRPRARDQGRAPGGRGAAGGGGHRARPGRGHHRDDRQARPRLVHRRAQHRHPGRRRRRRRRDVRGARRPVGESPGVPPETPTTNRDRDRRQPMEALS